MDGLTHSFVITKAQLIPILLHQEELVNDKNSPYYLLIYSTNSKFTKISVYPVNTVPVIKYFIGGPQITEDTINEILLILRPIHPIILHTSGIVLTDKRYEYEIYFTSSKETNFTHFKNKITQIPSIEFVADSKVPCLSKISQ
ncbi:MAG: hypothetical protein ACTSRE_02045 [Promethearchaeota archaeon]